jgi:hypothetical protein
MPARRSSDGPSALIHQGAGQVRGRVAQNSITKLDELLSADWTSTTE